MSSISGRVWKFGDNINTDLMLPGRITYPVMAGKITPEQTVEHCMSANRPGWHAGVRPGDVIIGGRNFGTGSGRPAYVPLKALGIQAVIAESVARLFFRNCINGGFLVIGCPGITAVAEEGEHIEIDLSRGHVTNPRSGRRVSFSPLPADSPPMEILRAGGLIPYMKLRLAL